MNLEDLFEKAKLIVLNIENLATDEEKEKFEHLLETDPQARKLYTRFRRSSQLQDNLQELKNMDLDAKWQKFSAKLYKENGK